MLPDKEIKKENEMRDNQQAPIDSDKESKNKLWMSKISKFLKREVKIGRVECPLIYLLLIVLIVGLLIIQVLYHSPIREILSDIFVHDSRQAVVSEEHGEVRQQEAEDDEEHNVSEAEQVALTDDGEVTEQPGEVGDTFKECDDCPEMVVVPPGSFLMGSPKDEEGRFDFVEGPQHQVAISEPFAVSKYELTRGQFRAFVDATGYAADTNWLEPGFEQSDVHPVVNISWDDAQAYLSWLSKETGHQYRLLSEAEWEYAVRAGTSTRYHFGDTISSDQANYGENNGGTVEVGSYPANDFGLYDMHGNVWEWMEDCWHHNYEGAPTDGSVWLSDCDKDARVLRGGAWDAIPRTLRSAVRGWNGSRYHHNYGFRVARTLKP